MNKQNCIYIRKLEIQCLCMFCIACRNAKFTVVKGLYYVMYKHTNVDLKIVDLDFCYTLFVLNIVTELAMEAGFTDEDDEEESAATSQSRLEIKQDEDYESSSSSNLKVNEPATSAEKDVSSHQDATDIQEECDSQSSKAENDIECKAETKKIKNTHISDQSQDNTSTPSSSRQSSEQNVEM